ncbi:T6SS phospholipase effector Tle1-like catalytic domain-containing protein, partial [Snodgrassella communis]
PGGRLPASIEEIQKNRGDCFYKARNAPKPCQKILKISFFFDGTNNHEKADKVVTGAKPPSEEELKAQTKAAPQAKLIDNYTYPRTSNVARLYHACLGAGGGAGENNLDPDMIENGWFRYYIQGVGTRFEEIGDLDPGFAGEAFARYGQARINWALTRLCDALGQCKIYNDKPLKLTEAQKMIKSMDSRIGRKSQLDQFIEALVPAPGNKPLPQAIKLYVIGFSRGAAEGRTFINWLLDYLLDRPENAEAKEQLEKLLKQRQEQRAKLRQYYRKYPDKEKEAIKVAKEQEEAANGGPTKPPQNKTNPSQGGNQQTGQTQQGGNQQTGQTQQGGNQQTGQTQQGGQQPGSTGSAQQNNAGKPAFIYLKLRGIPISIEMAGLFDTVANVGMSPLVSMISGHFSWAHGTMSLERAAAARFVKNCYHFVAGHEQRKSFSVESICIDGGYPHGGGGEFREYTYPGVHADIGGGYPPGEQFKSNFGMGHVVAQIALHDMYARCWQHGMPMLIWAKHPQLVAQMKKTPRFKLKNYEIMNSDTRKEFDTQPEMVTRFNAWRDVSITDNLNQNLRQQVHHITAWRILRWVKDGVNGYADFLGLQMAPGKGTAGEKEDPAQVSAREQIIRQGRNRANEKAKAGAGGGLPPAPAPDSKKEDELWQQAGLGDIPPEKRDDFMNGMINKNYDPRNDGWDMLESAKDFKADYLHQFRFESFLSLGFLMKTFAGSIYMLNNEDEAEEFKDIHDNGDILYFGDADKKPPQVPLPPNQDDGFDDDPLNTGTQPAKKPKVISTPPIAPSKNDDKSIFSDLINNMNLGAVVSGIALDVLKHKVQRAKAMQDAALNGKNGKIAQLKDLYALGADIWKRLKAKDSSDMKVLMDRIRNSPEAYTPKYPEVTELFDEQIHDSRAKYMHTLLSDREPFTSYFSHRLIFSGSYSNKPLTPMLLKNNLAGLTGIARSAYMSIRYGNPAYILLGLNNPELFVTDADYKALDELKNGFDAIVIDPDTGKVLMDGKNLKKLIDMCKKSQQAMQQLQESLNQVQPWNMDEFADKILKEIAKNGNETLKNLEQIRELLQQQKQQLAKMVQAATAGANTPTQIASMAAADEASASMAEAGGAETAIKMQQQLDGMLKAVEDRIQQLQAALDPANQVGDGSAAARVQNLLSQLDIQPAGSQNLNLVEGMADTQIRFLPKGQVLEDINPQAMADYLRAQIDEYRQNLQRQTANAVKLMQNGEDDPQTLAQVFYRNAQGDIADQAVSNISRTTLNSLGMQDLELNEFLPENIANRSRAEITQLLEQLRSGQIPAELQSLPQHRLQIMARVLESWLA